MADKEVKIPTEEEIAKLPRWAQVAFAARCARRVQPLFVDGWPDAPQKYVDAVDRSITLAEASAVSPATASDLKAATYATIRGDFDLLVALSEREGWDDETPVGPEVFGPMWPEGEPEGWPEEDGADEPSCFKIEIASPSGMNESQSKAFNEKTAAFFAELSALHVAMGGTGLKILDEDSFESELIEQDHLVCKPSDTSGVAV